MYVYLLSSHLWARMDEEGTKLVNGVATDNIYHIHTVYQNVIPDLLTQRLSQNAYACLREPVNTNVSASARST